MNNDTLVPKYFKDQSFTSTNESDSSFDEDQVLLDLSTKRKSIIKANGFKR